MDRARESELRLFSVNGVGVDPTPHDRISLVSDRPRTETGSQGSGGIGQALRGRLVERHGRAIRVDFEPCATHSYTPCTAGEHDE